MEDNTLICEFMNTVHSSAAPELLEFLAKQGIPWDLVKSARGSMFEERNRQESPLLAANIERHALRRT